MSGYDCIPTGRPRLLFAALDKVVDIILPRTCIACDALVLRSSGCCARCWSQLQFISEPMCPIMGTPFSIDLGRDIVSPQAIADPPSFDRLRACVLYGDLARRLVSLLKYADRTDLVPTLGRMLWAAGQSLLADADMITPLPLHSARLRQRRFNQSAELARFLAARSRVSYEPQVLVRHRRTLRQVGLSESERARNVRSAFRVPTEFQPQVVGKRILLVDDVYTTGATAKSAARTLKRAGADAVDVLVFARVETVGL